MNMNKASYEEICSFKKLIKEGKDILKLLEKRKQNITDCEKVLFRTIRDEFEQFDNTMTLIREAAALNRAAHPVNERVSLIFDTLLDRLDETHKNQIRVIEMLEDVSRSKDTIAAEEREQAVSVKGAETVLQTLEPVLNFLEEKKGEVNEYEHRIHQVRAGNHHEERGGTQGHPGYTDKA